MSFICWLYVIHILVVCHSYIVFNVIHILFICCLYVICTLFLVVHISFIGCWFVVGLFLICLLYNMCMLFILLNLCQMQCMCSFTPKYLFIPRPHVHMSTCPHVPSLYSPCAIHYYTRPMAWNPSVSRPPAQLQPRTSPPPKMLIAPVCKLIPD